MGIVVLDGIVPVAVEIPANENVDVVLQQIVDDINGIMVYIDNVEGKSIQEVVRIWIKVFVKELRMKEGVSDSILGT